MDGIGADGDSEPVVRMTDYDWSRNRGLAAIGRGCHRILRAADAIRIRLAVENGIPMHDGTETMVEGSYALAMGIMRRLSETERSGDANALASVLLSLTMTIPTDSDFDPSRYPHPNHRIVRGPGKVVVDGIPATEPWVDGRACDVDVPADAIRIVDVPPETDPHPVSIDIVVIDGHGNLLTTDHSMSEPIGICPPAPLTTDSGDDYLRCWPSDPMTWPGADTVVGGAWSRAMARPWTTWSQWPGFVAQVGTMPPMPVSRRISGPRPYEGYGPRFAPGRFASAFLSTGVAYPHGHAGDIVPDCIGRLGWLGCGVYGYAPGDGWEFDFDGADPFVHAYMETHRADRAMEMATDAGAGTMG